MAIAKRALVLLCVAGCAPTHAVVDGRTVPRPTLRYTDGRLYAVTHKNAFPDPRGPRDRFYEYEGSITGHVCGVEVRLEAEHYGRRVALSGFVNPPFTGSNWARPVILEARDRAGGVRELSGTFQSVSLAQRDLLFRSPVIDLHLRSDHLGGRVGIRKYDLYAAGDRMVGTVLIDGAEWPFELIGVAELHAMPAATQATILPLMLSCTRLVNGRYGQPLLSVDLTRRK